MSEIQPGQIIDDKYLLLEKLGEGGSALVFKANERMIDRLVAVKFLKPAFFPADTTKARFEQEARILSHLVHPNIIKFYRFGVHESVTPFLVVEYCDGTSLLERIHSDGGIPVRQCLEIAITICQAMDSAHQQGVLHRDLKPDNILIPSSGNYDQLKIVDFGLAKMLVTTTEHQVLTKTGQVLGSLPYMSPEQCRTGKADVRSDVYALCCLLFEMLCLRTPFEVKSSPGEMIQHHVNTPAPRLSEAAPHREFPSGLEEVVLKGLRKSRDERHQSMLELCRDLQAIAAGGTPHDDWQSRRRWRNGGIWLSAALLLLFSLLSSVSYFTRHKDDISTTSNSTTINSPHFVARKSQLIHIAEKYYSSVEPSNRQKNLVRVVEASSQIIERRPKPPDLVTMQAYYFRGCARNELSSYGAAPHTSEWYREDFRESIRYATRGDGRRYRIAFAPMRELAKLDSIAGNEPLANRQWRLALYTARSEPEHAADELITIQWARDATRLLERNVLNSQLLIGDKGALNKARDLVNLWRNSVSDEKSDRYAYMAAVNWLAGWYHKEANDQARDRLLKETRSWLARFDSGSVLAQQWAALGDTYVSYNHDLDARECFEKSIESAQREACLATMHSYSALSRLDESTGDLDAAARNARKALDVELQLGKAVAVQQFWSCDFYALCARFRIGDREAAQEAATMFEEKMANPSLLELDPWTEHAQWLACVADLQGRVGDRNRLMQKILDKVGTLGARNSSEWLASKYLLLAWQYRVFGLDSSARELQLQATGLLNSAGKKNSLLSDCYASQAKNRQDNGYYEDASQLWRQFLGVLPARVAAKHYMRLRCKIQCCEYLAGRSNSAAEADKLFRQVPVATASETSPAAGFEYLDLCSLMGRIYVREHQIASLQRMLAEVESQLRQNIQKRANFGHVNEWRLALADLYFAVGMPEDAMKHVRIAMRAFCSKRSVRFYGAVNYRLLRFMRLCDGLPQEREELRQLLEDFKKSAIV